MIVRMWLTALVLALVGGELGALPLLLARPEAVDRLHPGQVQAPAGPDVEALLVDFYDKAFGPATAAMRRYYERPDPGNPWAVNRPVTREETEREFQEGLAYFQ